MELVVGVMTLKEKISFNLSLLGFLIVNCWEELGESLEEEVVSTLGLVKEPLREPSEMFEGLHG